MKTSGNKSQTGSTLIISMIMLIALTVLVVFAIRMSNTNLRIAGNTQAQAEASAVAQDAIEQTIEKIVAVDDLSLIAAQTVTVTTGAKTYTATVDKMNTCLLEVPVETSTLNTANANDIPCFASRDPDRAVLDTGELSGIPAECKTQQWDIQAHVDDGLTGAKVDLVQGVTVRVPSTVTCL